MNELPEGWARSQLGDLVEFAIGGDWGKDLNHYDDGFVEVRCIRGTELRNWSTELGRSAAARKIKEASLDKRALAEDDLIVEISGGGPEQPVGRTVRIVGPALDQHAPVPLVCTNFFRKIRLTSPEIAPFIERFLGFDYATGGTIGIQSGSNNLRNLNFNSFLEKQLPIAPLSEQQSIVRKLDTLSARTTTAHTHLSAVATLVERYKLAVLEKAYFGPQTNEWDRVSFLDTTESTQNGLSKRRGDEGKPTKVLRLADLSGNVFVGEDPREIVLTEKEEERFSLLPDDIVIVRVNGSEKIVGRMLVWTNEPEWSYCDHFIRARVSSTYSPSFIRWLFETNTIRTQIEATFVSSAGQKTINKTILSQVMVPSIAIEEQREIVRWIETAFAKIDRLASEADTALKLADRLDQRILAKAFAGELVPQDPSDEPASELLDRIREARANASKKPRKKPTKAKSMKVAPQERVLTDSAEWPEQGLPFEDIAKRLTLPHDDLKDAVFALLEGDAPKLRQEFDTDAKVMKIVRVTS